MDIISIRIPKELKKELKEYNINYNNEVRNYLPLKATLWLTYQELPLFYLSRSSLINLYESSKIPYFAFILFLLDEKLEFKVYSIFRYFYVHGII